MSQTVKTESQLLTDWADNVSGAITPQDGRDVIVSCFGWSSNSNPTANNDAVDTAGIGAFFDLKSTWFNSTTGVLWVCKSGATGAAVWESQGGGGIAIGDAVGGSNPNSVLFVDGSGNLSDDTGLYTIPPAIVINNSGSITTLDGGNINIQGGSYQINFNESELQLVGLQQFYIVDSGGALQFLFDTSALTISNLTGSKLFVLGGSQAGSFTDGTTTTLLCDGTYTINGTGPALFSGTVTAGAFSTTGNVDAASFSVSGTAGASGTFLSQDGFTVTVVNGIITSIV